VFPESSENFADMLCVVRGVIGIDKYVVKIDNDRNVKEIGKNVVNEVLKSRRGISETFRDNQPFKGAIASTEGGLPFIAFGDPDQMVGVFKVDFSVDACSPGSVKKVRGKGNRIAVFLRDTVESSEIHAKSETTVLLTGEKNRSSTRGTGGADETSSEILIEEFPEGFELQRRDRVNGAKWRLCTVF
jgi:hypothetical protein